MILIKAMGNSYDRKDELKAAGAIFGKYSDGITSKFWAFETTDVEEAKEKMDLINAMGLTPEYYFTNAKSVKSEFQLSAEEDNMGRELYYYIKKIKGTN